MDTKWWNIGESKLEPWAEMHRQNIKLTKVPNKSGPKTPQRKNKRLMKKVKASVRSPGT